MKRNLSYFLMLAVVASFSCNNSETSTTTTTDSTTTTTPSLSPADTTSSTTSMTPTYSSTPLGKEDSAFVMKAAMGGMEEVQGGNTAQQNAESQRVKDFGAMMVRDHSAANNELKSLASAKGLTIPDSLPADKQKHLAAMAKMTGKAFDSHYMGMMVTDHKKDVAEFEKAASSAQDADLKAWAAKTLPVLKTHMDSATAINKKK